MSTEESRALSESLIGMSAHEKPLSIRAGQKGSIVLYTSSGLRWLISKKQRRGIIKEPLYFATCIAVVTDVLCGFEERPENNNNKKKGSADKLRAKRREKKQHYSN